MRSCWSTYALAYAETGRPLFRDAGEGIVAWLQREMTLPEVAPLPRASMRIRRARRAGSMSGA